MNLNCMDILLYNSRVSTLVKNKKTAANFENSKVPHPGPGTMSSVMQFHPRRRTTLNIRGRLVAGHLIETLGVCVYHELQ